MLFGVCVANAANILPAPSALRERVAREELRTGRKVLSAGGVRGATCRGSLWGRHADPPLALRVRLLTGWKLGIRSADIMDGEGTGVRAWAPNGSLRTP